MSDKAGITNSFCDLLHAEKYRLDENEDFGGFCSRLADSLTKDSSDSYNKLWHMFYDLRFLFAGRVNAALGSTKNVTAFNCFVNPTIEDSFVHGENSIMNVATKTAATMRMGGGVGSDFSTLRPSGDVIKGVHGTTDGPLAFLPIYNAIGEATSSSGNRRGAQMAILRIDHPDIYDFVKCKQNTDQLTGFNISVAVTDEFIHHLENKKPFSLRFGGKEYKTVDPAHLWNEIMKSTWDWAEPGVIFIDRINEMNNLNYCETIAATNPCAEQPLPPLNACLLGSFNLPKYLVYTEEKKFRFDWPLFNEDIVLAVRAADNIFENTNYPLEEQKSEVLSKRRIGLGITGLANCLEALGFEYGSEGFIQKMEQILVNLRDRAYLASVSLAEEKGAFPLFDKDRYLESGFIKTLPEYIQKAIYENGIRNSHLISIAPTGTISVCADNVSSGIEPIIGKETKRKIKMKNGEEVVVIKDYMFAKYGVEGKLAHEVSSQEHLAVLASAQKFCDSSVSKTCNIDSSMKFDDFKQFYYQAWKLGAKGLSTFRLDGKRFGVIENVSCEIDPETGRKECG